MNKVDIKWVAKRIFLLFLAICLLGIWKWISFPVKISLNRHSNKIEETILDAILTQEKNEVSTDSKHISSKIELHTGFMPIYGQIENELKQSVNFSVDPCEDFYDFACGNWAANNPLPENEETLDVFNKLQKKVEFEQKELLESKYKSSSQSIEKIKLYYQRCTNIEEVDKHGIDEFMMSFKTLGYDWPILHGKKRSAGNFDLTQLLIKVGVSRSIGVFFDFQVYLDEKTQKQRFLKFSEALPILGNRAYYLNQTRFYQRIGEYRTILTERIEFISNHSGIVIDNQSVERQINEILVLETKLAELVPKNKKKESEMANEPNANLNDLDKIAPAIDWLSYLLAVTPVEVHPYLKRNPRIIIQNMKYYEKVSEILLSTEARILTNYILLRYVTTFGKEVASDHVNIDEHFQQSIGTAQKTLRWKQCRSEIEKIATFATSSLYVRKHFDPRGKPIVEEIVNNLKSSFSSLIKHNDWMDNHTKEKALAKIRRMGTHIGYPDWILNDKTLDEYYNELNFTANDSYFQLVKKQRKFTRNRAFKLLLQPVKRYDTWGNSATVNAFHSYYSNIIFFPAAILQPPFFHPSYPKELNYGGIGTIIGHEITHGFDMRGRNFDKFGDSVDWWDSETQNRFEERSECMKYQYESINISIPGINLNVNGTRTLSENIADNGGVKEAFNAYKLSTKFAFENRIPGFEQFNRDQMFYISFAQPFCAHLTEDSMFWKVVADRHAPQKYRVNTVLQNQPQFARAFKCASQSAMNPLKKCTVW